MTKTIEMFDKDGNPINAKVMPDGGRLRTHMTLMDGARPDIASITRAAMADSQPSQAAMNRPGTLALSAADCEARETTRDARKAKLSDAWRNPPALDPAHIDKPAPTTPTGDAATRRDRRLEQMWRA
jgi:hypothetical protein